jgi:putative ABC transport system permease protein
MNTLLQDLRYTLRQLRKSPGFTAIAVLTLALGIGANTAIFSVINSALLKPLPYPHAEQLVDVMETLPDGGPNGSISGGAFKDWRDHSTKFAQLAVYEDLRKNLTGAGTPERVNGLQVSAEYLSVLGIAPAVGRGFTASDAAIGGNNQVALLTHSFWNSHFAGDPGIVGKTVSLDLVPYTVIGVLPPRALWQDDVQFLIPEVVDAPNTYWGRAGHWRRAVGRLLPGTSSVEAQAELKVIKQQLAAQYPPWKDKWSVSVTPLQELFVGGTRPMLVLLLGAVALVLLIACANVSNLLLARGNARSREMAVRFALGANTWRIVRQMLTESILLAFSGCAVGLLLAVFGVRLLTHLVEKQLPQILQPRLDSTVLWFSVLVSCGCGILFGILPAWRATKADVNQAMKESERGLASHSKRRSQSLLVVSEFAFTLILLIGAGLFLRSFVRVTETDLGFNPKQTVAFDLSFSEAKYPTDADRLRFTKDLIERFRVLPGVESAGSISTLPLSGMERGEFLSRTDKPEPPTRYMAGVDSVGGDYFSTLGIRLLGGRFLTEGDNIPTAPPVVVIDSGIVRDLYPNENPLGKHVKLLGKVSEIVGIVAPVRQRTIDNAPRSRVYGAEAFFSSRSSNISIVVRNGLASSLVETLRKTVLEADPDQPIANVRTLERDVDRSLASRRTALLLLGIFATVAISLACIGIYGVMSYAISQRVRELSIRSALGAQRREIVRLVLAGGMRPAMAGIAAGLVAALGLSRLVESQLFEVKARDPLVFLASVCLLVLVAALSIYLPARRASRVDPALALRYE